MNTEWIALVRLDDGADNAVVPTIATDPIASMMAIGVVREFFMGVSWEFGRYEVAFTKAMISILNESFSPPSAASPGWTCRLTTRICGYVFSKSAMNLPRSW